MNEEHWTKEEFEDTITRAMFSIYDYEWNYEFPESELDPTVRFTPQDWAFVRRRGLYFTARDRLMDSGGIDIRNDGLPPYALLSLSVDMTEEEAAARNVVHDYLRIVALKRIERIHPPFLSPGLGIAKYMMYVVNALPKGGCAYLKRPFVVGAEGTIHPCNHMRWNGFKMVRERLDKVDPDEYEMISKMGSCCVSGWQDRRFLWNVTATDGQQKAMFGVYPAEVKSLFYSRKEPVTATGRLRPILHWVKSHRRRLKKGIEIDIDDHLRGSNKFIMDGYEFKVERPEKC
jgi:hypothetical protein